MKKIVVKNNEEGKRVDKFVQSYLVNAKSSFIYKMFRKKNILLNDKTIEGSEKIKIGDTISIFFSDETIEKFTKKTCDRISDLKNINTKPMIVFENDDIMIVDKPIGVLSQKSKDDDTSMNEICLKYLFDKGEIDEESLKTFRPSVINRLDKNTYGLLIFAKNYKASKEYTEKMKNKDSIKKYYLAIVNGIVKDDKKELNAYLMKDEKINKVYISETEKEGYYNIKTEYEVVERGKDLTLLRIKLITGKSHQIRAQFAYLGHPLLGDKKYMSESLYKMNLSKYNAKTQALLCYKLVIDGISYDTKYSLNLPK